MKGTRNPQHSVPPAPKQQARRTKLRRQATERDFRNLPETASGLVIEPPEETTGEYYLG